MTTPPTGPPTARPPRADAQRNRARILDAAEQVFSAQGRTASTEDVARLAGVAIGTVFRHFPTKRDLLAAIMKRLLARLAEEAAELARTDDGTGLRTFFTRLVRQAAAQKAVLDLLAGAGVPIDIGDAIGQLERAVDELLSRARDAGTVAADVRLPEVMALLSSVCQGALHGGWDPALQDRTVAVVFAGLRESPTGSWSPADP